MSHSKEGWYTMTDIWFNCGSKACIQVIQSKNCEKQAMEPSYETLALQSAVLWREQRSLYVTGDMISPSEWMMSRSMKIWKTEEGIGVKKKKNEIMTSVQCFISTRFHGAIMILNLFFGWHWGALRRSARTQALYHFIQSIILSLF